MNKKIIIAILILFLILGGTLLFILNYNQNKYDDLTSMNLYKTLIDKYIDDLNKTNSEYFSISIESNSLKNISTNAQLPDNLKNEIISYYKTTYEKNPNNSSNIIFNITFNISKVENNTININIKHSISNSNSIGGRSYICKYINNSWTISNGNTAWSS